MRTVYKYTLPPDVLKGNWSIELPGSAYLLSVAVQNGVICLWYEVETEDPVSVHTFRVFGTGWEIPKFDDIRKRYYHMETFFDDPFVWHLYELICFD